MKEEKEYFARFPKLARVVWIAWALILGFAIGGTLYASKVRAEPVRLGTVENDAGSRVTLLDAPCDSPTTMALISGNVPEEYRNGWKKLDAVFAMKPDGHIQRFEGCWYDLHGIVTLVFEDGDHLDMPRSAFKRPADA